MKELKRHSKFDYNMYIQSLGNLIFIPDKA